jgi:hypothetical protein
MDLKEWCEYMRDIRDYFGLTNEYITKKAESSTGTTERIMAANTNQDVMRATARRYEQSVIGPVGEFTCYLDHDHSAADQIAALKVELARVNEELARERKENDRKAKIIDRFMDA